MNAAQPDWVQQSLARLEMLEAQREQLESSGQLDRLPEIDEEIASLYEVLETGEILGPVEWKLVKTGDQWKVSAFALPAGSAAGP